MFELELMTKRQDAIRFLALFASSFFRISFGRIRFVQMLIRRDEKGSIKIQSNSDIARMDNEELWSSHTKGEWLVVKQVLLKNVRGRQMPEKRRVLRE